MILEGVYKQVGLPDTYVPLAVNSGGELATTGGTGGGGLTNTELRASPLNVEPLGIPSVARQITVTVTSVNTVLTGTCKRISIKARNCDMRFMIGSTSQTASSTTSHCIGVDERLDFSVPLNANIAVIRDSLATSDGTLCITELI